MVFGKKKKVEDIAAGTVGADGMETPPMPKIVETKTEQPQKLTPEQKKKIDELQQFLGYFNENYAIVNFGEELGVIKQLLFGIFCELKKLNDSQNEE